MHKNIYILSFQRVEKLFMEMIKKIFHTRREEDEEGRQYERKRNKKKRKELKNLNVAK